MALKLAQDTKIQLFLFWAKFMIFETTLGQAQKNICFLFSNIVLDQQKKIYSSETKHVTISHIINSTLQAIFKNILNFKGMFNLLFIFSILLSISNADQWD